MWYGEAKVYFDGSHYIAIPHTERYALRKRKKYDEIITIKEDETDEVKELPFEEVDSSFLPFDDDYDELFDDVIEEKPQKVEKEIKKSEKNTRKMAKKAFFNELYQKYIDLKKSERKKIIIKEMTKYFKSEEDCSLYVSEQFERKQRNLICRKVRMVRKANLANFNYFCTFTYDDTKHSEYTFKKKLKNALSLFSSRKKWKYMGVWERAPKTKRLHFHGLFNIPKDTLPGSIVEVRDYNTISHKMQTTLQSSYFNERFGRSDFKEIDEYDNKLGNAIAYLMKYIEKTGEK